MVVILLRWIKSCWGRLHGTMAVIINKNALQVMDRYWKEVLQVSTWKNDIKVQYLYDSLATWINLTLSHLNSFNLIYNWQIHVFPYFKNCTLANFLKWTKLKVNIFRPIKLFKAQISNRSRLLLMLTNQQLISWKCKS